MHYRTGVNALNKCKWNQDGTKLVIGDSHGSVNVLGFNKNNIEVTQEKIEAFDLFVNTPKVKDKIENL